MIGTTRRLIACTVIVAAAMMLVAPSTSYAQLNGQNIKGDVGLKSGSQAPAGAYVVVPLWFYNADQVKDRDGHELISGDLSTKLYGVALSVVTQKKLFGGVYGFTAALPFVNNRLQGIDDFDSNPGSGVSDTYLQPLNLGWHTPRADAVFGYALFIPTGRYEDGASNNTGLGMWAQEFLVGTTVYLNEKRSVHVATAATLDVQSKKKDSDTKVGNILNLEGGAGVDLIGGGLTTGLAYYGTFKLTDDEFDSALPNLLVRGKNSVWGLGPEVTLALAAKKKVYGFLTVRYQWEMAAKTTTEGSAWNISLVLPLKPIAIP